MRSQSENILLPAQTGRCIYQANLKGDDTVSVFTNEIQKKHFLDMLLDVREGFPVEIYAYCVLDREAHFLMGCANDGEATDAMEQLGRQYREYYQRIFGLKYVSVHSDLRCMGSLRPSEIFNEAMEMHRLPVFFRYVHEPEDYWWSSLKEYLLKYRSGLICPEILLSLLDENPGKAVKKMRRMQRIGD